MAKSNFELNRYTGTKEDTGRGKVKNKAAVEKFKKLSNGGNTKKGKK